MHCAGPFEPLLDSTSLVLPIDDVENDEKMSPKACRQNFQIRPRYFSEGTKLCCEGPFSFTVRLMVLCEPSRCTQYQKVGHSYTILVQSKSFDGSFFFTSLTKIAWLYFPDHRAQPHRLISPILHFLSKNVHPTY